MHDGKKSSYCLYLRQVFITLQENMGCLQECKLKLILYGFSINTKNIIPGKKKIHFGYILVFYLSTMTQTFLQLNGIGESIKKMKHLGLQTKFNKLKLQVYWQ